VIHPPLRDSARLGARARGLERVASPAVEVPAEAGAVWRVQFGERPGVRVLVLVARGAGRPLHRHRAPELVVGVSLDASEAVAVRARPRCAHARGIRPQLAVRPVAAADPGTTVVGPY